VAAFPNTVTTKVLAMIPSGEITGPCRGIFQLLEHGLIRQAWGLIRDHQINVLQSHGYNAELLSSCFAKWTGLPLPQRTAGVAPRGLGLTGGER
jgi:hypothetical protein